MTLAASEAGGSASIAASEASEERSRPGSRPSASETVRRSLLSSGLRVVSEPLPGVRSVSIGVWIPVGSVDETAGQFGAAHYLEHLLFKGTARRTAARIAEEIDAVGGELNAFTAKEHTCFYAQVLDTDLPLAVDLLADVVTAATMSPADVELERAVVLEEIAMRDDDPEDLVGELFDAALFGEHGLGRPVLGTEASVRALSRAELDGFWRRHYRPERMVVAAAGNLEHERVVRLVDAAFAPAPRRVVSPRSDDERPSANGRSGASALVRRVSDHEQTHLLLGVPTPGRTDPRHYALGALNTALGGGTSSRLFQQVREQRGLAYSVYSATVGYAEIGSLSVYVACRPERVDDVVALTLGVMADIAAGGLTPAELDRAKGAMRGGLVLGLEDTASRMHRLGRVELDEEQRSIADSLAAIEAVTSDEVGALATEVLGAPLTAAVVGPQRSVGALPSRLRALGG